MTRYEPTVADAPLEALLTINDVYKWLAIGRDTVYALVRRGELEPVRVSSRARFDPDEIRDYLHRHKQRATEERLVEQLERTFDAAVIEEEG
jgi:excisionase family DNA binding protein